MTDRAEFREERKLKLDYWKTIIPFGQHFHVVHPNRHHLVIDIIPVNHPRVVPLIDGNDPNRLSGQRWSMTTSQIVPSWPSRICGWRSWITF
jgi:hypothetical protein